eukprot:CAMPEP_0206420780 /NCGR_PEP_ID=MMETSP0324_2-20121206/1066_1 /ASSEMBLY_ACC=CAM_ASM_000836 /TAXON_ID=2866 /ORGANISM="Crypthecodinium cohnii, Strain Seligo" /LENGTH=76 /DNA_ID=CAMNT_0053884769 /DNA_START=653 /DNA_END=880 /DNA_ORIENTATION=-
MTMCESILAVAVISFMSPEWESSGLAWGQGALLLLPNGSTPDLQGHGEISITLGRWKKKVLAARGEWISQIHGKCD